MIGGDSQFVYIMRNYFGNYRCVFLIVETSTLLHCEILHCEISLIKATDIFFSPDGLELNFFNKSPSTPRHDLDFSRWSKRETTNQHREPTMGNNTI